MRQHSASLHRIGGDGWLRRRDRGPCRVRRASAAVRPCPRTHRRPHLRPPWEWLHRSTTTVRTT